MTQTRLRFLFGFLFTCCFLCLASSFVIGSPVKRGAGRCPVAAPKIDKAQWTVMIYLNGDNDLNYGAIDDFEEMARVTYGRKVNVVVQMDLLDGEDTDVSWSETRRFQMTKGLKPWRSCALPGFNEEANMGSLTTLADFVLWATRSFPAQRYALIIWDHGDGWRYLDRISNRSELARQRRQAVSLAQAQLSSRNLTVQTLSSLNIKQVPLGPQYRAASIDETNEGDMLFDREIQDALEFALRGAGKLDLIGFDACLMQMIETAYALRRVADVMVGSEDLEPDTGWSYGDWLQTLANDPYMNGATLGKLIVHSYEKTYKLKDPTTTLSALDMSKDKLEKLATAVTSLADALLEHVDSDLTHIEAARNGCDRFAPDRNYHGIDLHRFALLLSESKADPTLKAEAKRVKVLLERQIIARYAGSRRQGNFGSRGLAIYFPKNGKEFLQDDHHEAYTAKNIFYVVQFVREQKWAEFLEEYYKRITGESQ